MPCFDEADNRSRRKVVEKSPAFLSSTFTSAKWSWMRWSNPPIPSRIISPCRSSFVGHAYIRFSGITAERLSTATLNLASLQARLSTLITAHTILLGHSLENDLSVLKLRHPLCIDTSVLYRSTRGGSYKPGLKWLAQKWLEREIQGGHTGHDSVEDAQACVDLLKLKMTYGALFQSAPADDRSGLWILYRFQRVHLHPNQPRDGQYGRG